MTLAHRLPSYVTLLAGLLVFHPAHAAQSYDNCAGTISSLPATITTQGVWCLKGDLSTSIAYGNAIEIAANNVTIDCNDFKLGGLAAGDASTTIGIYAIGRQNATVRHCNIRGFHYGIYMTAGAGNLIEDNRLDNNLYTGIAVYGDNTLVQRNRVYDTGGAAGTTNSYGVVADGGIVGNIVSGLFAAVGGGNLRAITLQSKGRQVRGNQVSGFQTNAGDGGVSSAYGIDVYPQKALVADNGVFGPDGAYIGIYGNGPRNYCKDNVVDGFTNGITSCTLVDNSGADSNMAP